MSEKQEKPKNLFEVAREIEEAQQAEAARLEAEAQALARQKAAEERAAYEKRLREERIELMRLRQGVIEESETIREERPEEQKYTFWQKVQNYIYHNKWWMGIAGFLVCVAGFLTYQTLTTVKPDVVVLLIADDILFYSQTCDKLETLLASYVEDVNGDGKQSVDIYYIPTSPATELSAGYTGDRTKLFAEFQLGTSLLVISDNEADVIIDANDNMESLVPYFGEYTQVRGHRFYLHETDFGEYMGLDEPLAEDLYIGIRHVKDSFTFKEDMQENFDDALPVLEQLIEQFGTKKE